MYERIILSLIVTFATVLFVAPVLMRYMKAIGVYGIDMQKGGEVVPESGGTAVAIGVFAGVLFYIALSTFVMKDMPLNTATLLVALLTIQTITLVGFIDDLFTSKTKNKDLHGDVNFRVGLSQKTKALLVLPAAIPLMVINAGQSSFSIPLLGMINIGIIYPLLVIPAIVLCVSNAVNMLAGINGVEAGMSATALYGLGIYAAMNGSGEAAAIALIGAVAFTAFLKFNWYPAKVFPGDSGTYLAGGLIATVVIIGGMDKFALIVFIPWIIEAFIKLKSRFRGTSFGKLNEAGFVKPKNGKIESLTHVAMSLGNFKEWQVTSVLIGFEALCVLTAFALSFAHVI